MNAKALRDTHVWTCFKTNIIVYFWPPDICRRDCVCPNSQGCQNCFRISGYIWITNPYDMPWCSQIPTPCGMHALSSIVEDHWFYWQMWCKESVPSEIITKVLQTYLNSLNYTNDITFSLWFDPSNNCSASWSWAGEWFYRELKAPIEFFALQFLQFFFFTSK